MSGKSVKDLGKKSVTKKTKAQLAKEAKAAEEMSKEELEVTEEAPETLAPPSKEVVDEGVTKTVDDEDIRVKMEENGRKTRIAGNWIKISSKKELVDYEMSGRLKGWDPVKSEVLLRE